MTQSPIFQIKKIISEMIELESKNSIDWEKCNRLADKALEIYVKYEVGRYCDPYLLKYLDDIDIRQSDESYARYQRIKTSEILARLIDT
jgi:hypothetical protein